MWFQIRFRVINSREAHAEEKPNQSLDQQASLELTIYTQRGNSDTQTQTQNDRNNSKP